MEKKSRNSLFMWFKEKEIRIANYFFILAISTASFIILIASFFWIRFKYKNLKEEITQMHISYIETQKNVIKGETERAIDYINFNINRSEEYLKRRIKTRVEHAYSIAQNIYLENRNTKTLNEIEKMILDALRSIRFENNTYFITNLNGIEILYPKNPKFEGKNLLSFQDDLGSFIVKDEINLAKTKGEGFITSYWNYPKSDTTGLSKRISYIKLFKTFNWYIGTSEYYSDYNTVIQKETLEWLSKQRYGEEGYIFVNTYNGDALLMDGNIVQEKRNVWELEDPNGVKVIQEERRAVKNPKGDYIFYSWRRLTDSVIIPKMSFIKGVPEWRWMVGAGVYIEEIDSYLAVKEDELRNEILKDSIYVIILILTIYLSLFVLGIFVSKRLRKNIGQFIEFFKTATIDYNLIDPSKVTYLEFKTIANYANKMISELKVSEKRKLEERAHYEKLFNNSPEAIAYLDNKGNVLRVNMAFSKLFGYTNYELEGQLLDDFIVPEGLKNMASEYTKEIEEGRERPIEAVRVNKNNEKIYVNILGTPVSVNRKQLGIYVVYRDITEQKNSEKILQDAKDKAEESDRLKTSFLTNLSHEIRTPLNAIIGFSSLLITKDYDTDMQRNYLSILHKSGNNLLEIIDNIVDLSKIQSSTLVINKAKVNLNTIIEELYIDYKQVIKEKGLKVVIHKGVENKDFNVLIDSKRVRQVFSNLIDNAIKFTEKGLIEFGYDINNNKIQCFVKDTGIGIEEKNISFIFNQFRQVDETSTRKYGGTGTGLALCKSLVDLMEGELKVESKIDQGATFLFTLPLEKVSKKPKVDLKKKERFSWKTKTILVAEDDSTNFELLKTFLEKTKAKIIWVKNGEDVLIEVNKNNNIDIILMDINMPIMNGNESIKQLKSKGIRIPVIAQTAYATQDKYEEIMHYGYNDYILKPIDQKLLLNKLSKFLD